MAGSDVQDQDITELVSESLILELTDQHLEWKFLGRHLGLTEGNLVEIEQNNKGDIKEMKYQTLLQWKWTSEQRPTIGKLAKALKKAGRTDLAEYVMQGQRNGAALLPPQPPNGQRNCQPPPQQANDKAKSLGEKLEACSIPQPDTVTDCLERKPNIKAENLDADEDNDKEDRKDNEKWFKDVPQNFKTKSEYMRDKAKVRTLNYLRDTKDMLLPKDSKDNTEMIKKKEHVIEEFKRKLKKNDFHENYFDKNADGKERLCNHDGKFVCQGSYIKGGCNNNNHHINPYLTEENRKTFRSWNFNHRIQKQEVLPQLKKAVENPSKEVNLDYFYGLLFTMGNFKLVHPTCHDESDHNLKVDEEQVYL